MNGSMFERLGGFARVRLLVSDFYDRILESEQLSRHFAHIDMRRLIDHQTKFIAAIMGGPASFTDEQIRRAHAPLNITGEEFQEMGMLLKETLEDFGLGAVEVDRICAHVLSMRDKVVASETADVS